ncbi:hypothetical protein B0T25DRAFT_335092 [Lasiosphaeria hispida]|uniref:C3H1-type domain-containing protein n=1 Tax=Lasiosphaeria hispida TaxID=260671 RepID=A0AAJ0M7Z1_9PEZI|nr:hypothetical protein B0T25DRAFT_335092 [Lasiosphaeria hispida]
MATQPRFFLVRPGVTQQTPSGAIREELGPIVPLVPLDELPPWLDIVGMPRELAVEDTVGMVNLGPIAKPEGTYSVRIMYQPSSPAPSDWADDVTMVGDSVEAIPVAAAGTSQPQAQVMEATAAAPAPAPAPGAHPADRMKTHWSEARASALGQQPALLPLKTTAQQPQPPQPGPKTAGKQPATTHADRTSVPTSSPLSPPEYCRHWCHHGTCKWGQRCRYVHAMPTTHGGLLEVGLSQYPAWWLMAGAGSLHDIGGPAAMRTGLGMGMGMGMGMGGLGSGRGLHGFQQQQQQQQQHQQLGMLGMLGGGVSNRKTKAREREARALLSELVLAAGVGGFYRSPLRKGREMTPLDKGKKKMAVSGAAMAAAAQGKPVPVGQGLVAAPARDQGQIPVQEAQGAMASANGPQSQQQQQQQQQQQGQAAITRTKAKKQQAEAKAPAIPVVGKLVEI